MKTATLIFLVDLESGRNLLDLDGLLMALEQLLPYHVDVTTPSLLKARIRQHVLSEAVALSSFKAFRNDLSLFDF